MTMAITSILTYTLLLPLLIILALACQCSQLPTPEPTAAPATPVPSSTMASYPTAGHTATFTPSPTLEPTATNTATATPEPTGTAVPTATPSPTLAASPVATAQNFYVVQKDDWLIKIAQFLYGGRYGWEWECLWQMNRGIIGDDPNLIFAGQKLTGIRECGE